MPSGYVVTWVYRLRNAPRETSISSPKPARIAWDDARIQWTNAFADARQQCQSTPPRRLEPPPAPGLNPIRKGNIREGLSSLGPLRAPDLRASISAPVAAENLQTALAASNQTALKLIA